MTEVPRVDIEQLSSLTNSESSLTIRARVLKARECQRERYEHAAVTTNAELTPALLREHCGLSPDCLSLLKAAMERLHLSARAYTRVLKVARTIADLANETTLVPAHLAEALQYRPKSLIR